MQSFTAAEKRGRARIEARLRIQVVGVDEYERTYTGNVSKDGVFLETSDPFFKNNQKLELLIYLEDDDDEPLRVLGKVTRSVKPNQLGRSKGIGIRFLKVESSRARTFDRFLERLFDARGLGCRRNPRAQVQVEVEIKTAKVAKLALTANLSKSGAFLKIPLDGFSIGDRLQVVLIHPTTKRKFTLQAQVVHLRKGHDPLTQEFCEGVGVHFTDLSELRNQDLTLFLKAILSAKKRKKE